MHGHIRIMSLRTKRSNPADSAGLLRRFTPRNDIIVWELNMKIKRIGILTGGGDCPGLNAVIRAVAKKAIFDYGWEVIGINDGFHGAVEKRGARLDLKDVSNILNLGGTILGTSNIADPFEYTLHGKKATDESDRMINNFKEFGIDALFCIGGDGTLSIANRLQKKWPHVIGIPKTIDNDLMATDQTFGFDTACNFVTEALDRIHTTAQSHHRVMVIEVMGRYAGWIALEGGLAGGGDIVLIPEIPFKYEKIIEAVDRRARKGKRFSIIVVSEGAHAKGEGYCVDQVIDESPDPIRLGGIGKHISNFVQKETGHESRVTVLGHLQRGGTPSFYDRVLGTRYGVRAAILAKDGDFGTMVALRGREIVPVSLEEATASLRLVVPNHPLVEVARSVGTHFGT